MTKRMDQNASSGTLKPSDFFLSSGGKTGENVLPKKESINKNHTTSQRVSALLLGFCPLILPLFCLETFGSLFFIFRLICRDLFALFVAFVTSCDEVLEKSSTVCASVESSRGVRGVVQSRIRIPEGCFFLSRVIKVRR